MPYGNLDENYFNLGYQQLLITQVYKMLIFNGLNNLEIKFMDIYLLYGLREKTSRGNIQ